MSTVDRSFTDDIFTITIQCDTCKKRKTLTLPIDFPELSLVKQAELVKSQFRDQNWTIYENPQYGVFHRCEECGPIINKKGEVE